MHDDDTILQTKYECNLMFSHRFLCLYYIVYISQYNHIYIYIYIYVYHSWMISGSNYIDHLNDSNSTWC